MKQATKLADLALGGLVLGQTKDGHCIYYTPEDTHSLIIGATRCGKTRCLVEPSIAMTALAGESMVMVDMKGELYTAARYFLESLGYEVIAIDFLNPQLSNRYNFMQPLIDALNQGQVAKAATRARDMATMLVPDNHTNESIWTDGERAVLTMSSLICAYDNVQNPQYQNLANVQQFITHMGRPIGAFGTALDLYLEMLPEEHPAKLSMVSTWEFKLMAATLAVIFTMFICVNVFVRMDGNNQSIYNFLKCGLRYRREQQTFWYKREEKIHASFERET